MVPVTPALSGRLHGNEYTEDEVIVSIVQVWSFSRTPVPAPVAPENVTCWPTMVFRWLVSVTVARPLAMTTDAPDSLNRLIVTLFEAGATTVNGDSAPVPVWPGTLMLLAAKYPRTGSFCMDIGGSRQRVTLLKPDTRTIEFGLVVMSSPSVSSRPM